MGLITTAVSLPYYGTASAMSPPTSTHSAVGGSIGAPRHGSVCVSCVVCSLPKAFRPKGRNQ